MSEASYQEKLRLGVVRQGACFPAAYDRISYNAEVSAETYVAYIQAHEAYNQAFRADPRSIPDEVIQGGRIAKQMVYRDLGCEYAELFETRVDTPQDLKNTLEQLCLEGLRTMVYLNYGNLHAVGVVWRGPDTYQLRSTKLNFLDEDASHASDIYNYLDRDGANVFALPPEPKK